MVDDQVSLFDKKENNNWRGNLPYKWLTYYTLFCLFCLVWNLIVPDLLYYIHIESEFLKVFTYSSTFPTLYGLIGGIIVLNHVDRSELKKWSSIANFLMSVWIIGFLSTAATLAIWDGIDYIDSGGPIPSSTAFDGVVIFILFTVIPFSLWFFLWMKSNKNDSNSLD